MNLSQHIGIATFLIGVATYPVQGSIILDSPETWDTGLQGWTVGIGTLGTGAADAPAVNPGAGGNPDGYFETTFSGPRLVPLSDTAATSASAFTGDYGQYSGLVVSFDFYATDLPLASAMFIESTDGSVWTYDAFAPTSTDSWSNYQVGFGSGWTEYTTLGTSFQDALADVSMIGFSFTVPFGPDSVSFGLDNWMYSYDEAMVIPEPEEWALLAMAVLGTLFVWQRNRRQLAFANVVASATSGFTG